MIALPEAPSADATWYERRRASQLICSNAAVQACGQKIRKGAPGTAAEVLEVKKSCRKLGLCVSCGFAESKKRCRRVTDLLVHWDDGTRAVLFLTLTQHHTNQDGLADLRGRADAGWKSLTTGETWRRAKRDFGIRHYLRFAEEVHHPTNGWNSHFHVLLLVDVRLGQEREQALKAVLAERFDVGVARLGGSTSRSAQHIMSMKPGGAAEMASYCTKGTTVLRSPSGSRSPMAILLDVAGTGDGLEAWREYEATVARGRRRVFSPSRGIDKVLNNSADAPVTMVDSPSPEGEGELAAVSPSPSRATSYRWSIADSDQQKTVSPGISRTRSLLCQGGIPPKSPQTSQIDSPDPDRRPSTGKYAPGSGECISRIDNNTRYLASEKDHDDQVRSWRSYGKPTDREPQHLDNKKLRPRAQMSCLPRRCPLRGGKPSSDDRGQLRAHRTDSPL